MTHSRNSDGLYKINGKKYKNLTGSRAQVWNRTTYSTSGGLTRKQLMMNKWGRIVSAAKHRTAKKEKRLEKAGFFAKKGKFGSIKKRGGGPEMDGLAAPTPTESPTLPEELPAGITDRSEERKNKMEMSTSVTDDREHVTEGVGIANVTIRK